MATQEFVLDAELPKHGVSEALRPHLIRYLIQGGFSCGDSFLSDSDVVKATGRSRSAIRLAFEQLQKEGWIERRSGAGTFVGPKVEAIKSNESSHSAPTNEHTDINESVREGVVTRSAHPSQRLLRLAIVASGIGRVSHSGWWLAPQLRGIDSLSEKYGIAVELLGDHTIKPQILSRRFKENRPDVLVSSGSPLSHLGVFGEAQRCQVPCILCSVRTPELNMPNIVDDAENAIVDAVQHLYDRGHRRIAYASLMLPHWWTFDRYEGYKKGMERCGLEHGNDLTLWLPASEKASEASAMQLKAFLDEKEPTAVIFNCSWAAANMQWLTSRDGLNVGEDLSVIVYDQHPEVAGWLGGVKPTVIAPPLYEMGKLIAEFARRAVEGQEIPPLSMLPCSLIEGRSVKNIEQRRG